MCIPMLRFPARLTRAQFLMIVFFDASIESVYPGENESEIRTNF